MKNLKTILIVLAFSLIGINAQNNEPNEKVNLALTEDVLIECSAINGRGNSIDILYNPATENYENPNSDYAEKGVGYKEKSEGFFYRVSWKSAKLINYITFGGAYPNQDQSKTEWIITSTYKDVTTVIDKGIGGWVDGGIFESDIENLQPFLTDAITVEIKENVSMTLRGRGGISKQENDFKTKTKACLIQLLPYVGEVVVEEPTDTDNQLYLKRVIAELTKALEETPAENIEVIIIEKE